MAAQLNYQLLHIDVDTAFLNAAMEEGISVYIEQPEGFVNQGYPDHVCLLKKSLYGLKQAPRLWQEEVSTFLTQNFSLEKTADPCIFKNSSILIAIYVDDIIIGAKTFEETGEILSTIETKYNCKDLGKLETYIGFEIHYKEHQFLITQRTYIERLLSKLNLANISPSDTPFKSTLGEVQTWTKPIETPYRSVIGALLYISTGTRPDISFIVNFLARHVEKPTHEAWECLKHVLRYLNGTKNLGLSFSASNLNTHLVHEVSAYSDSDWAGDKMTRRSTTGTVIFHNGNLVDWASKLQRSVSLSSFEAEIVAMSQSAQDIIWINRLIKSMQGESLDSFLKIPMQTTSPR
jgi:hypothetical protein